MLQAIHFGAGNIGRGFIGALLSHAEYQVIFVDINKDLIAELARKKYYSLEIVSEKETRREEIGPVTGLLIDNPQLMDAFLQADIITTAVGPNVLERIAPTIAKGIIHRLSKARPSPLHIIACENLIQASERLKNAVLPHISAELLDPFSQKVGFPNAVVDRIVPPMTDMEDLLSVRVEEFCEWIVDETGFIGPLLEITDMLTTKNLSAYVERKLFTLNTGHAITAYLGYLSHYQSIEESISNTQICATVKAAMEESGEVLIRRYQLERSAHHHYIEKILSRFRNPWLKDELSRVGREPIRKLGPQDRLVKPLLGALEYGIPHDNLLTGIAAALHFRNSEDPQARELETLIASKTLPEVISHITTITDAQTIDRIVSAYQNLLS